MRRISTDYSNRLPDDFVAIVLTEEEVTDILHCATQGVLPTALLSQFRKLLTEGDKWSES